MKKCILCERKLASWNKVGYCTKCYTKSPPYLKYQAQKQREWYAKPKNKEKLKIYRNKPKVKKRIKDYQKKYQKENLEKMRKLKRNWATKNRKKMKDNIIILWIILVILEYFLLGIICGINIGFFKNIL